jgi:hypothetical protein
MIPLTDQPMGSSLPFVAGARHVRYGKFESQGDNAANLPKSKVITVLDKTILTLMQVVQPDCDSPESHHFAANADIVTEILISKR